MRCLGYVETLTLLELYYEVLELYKAYEVWIIIENLHDSEEA